MSMIASLIASPSVLEREVLAYTRRHSHLYRFLTFLAHFKSAAAVIALFAGFALVLFYLLPGLLG